MRGKRVKKLLASALSAAMILTMLPMNAIAAEVETEVVEETLAEEAVVSVSGDTIAAGKYALNDEKYKGATEVTDVKGLYVKANAFNGTQHGFEMVSGNTIELNLEKKGIVNVYGCTYGSGAKAAADDTTYSAFELEGTGDMSAQIVPNPDEQNKDSAKYIIEDAEGELTLTVKANVKEYIHAVEVIYDEPSTASVEPFTFFFDDKKGEDGKVAPGEYKYGDSVLTIVGQGDEQYAAVDGHAVTVGDKTYNCYKAGTRHADVNAFKALPEQKSGTLTMFKAAASGIMTVYYDSTSFIRINTVTSVDPFETTFVDAPTNINAYTFAVEPGNTYIMSTTGKTNNMFYAGYQYIPNEKLKVPFVVSNLDATINEGLKIQVMDAQLDGVNAGTMKADTTMMRLMKGHTYKFDSNDGGVKALVNGKETFTVNDDSTVVVTLNNVPDETLTGKITGAAAGTVTKLVFKNMISGAEVEAKITGDSYEAVMKPGEYSAIVETTNGGVTYDRASVKAGVANVDEVFVEVPNLAVAKKYIPKEIAAFETTGAVQAREDNGGDVLAQKDATIKIPVAVKSKVVVSTYYQASFDMEGKACLNETKSTGENVEFDMVADKDVVLKFDGTSYLRSISVTPYNEFKSELNVPGDYDTLNQASEAILGMLDRPEGEAGRVTINLTKDIFEQTVMNAPYVTLKGNGHTVSWYYGVGTKYYSIEPSSGLYSERLARDRYSAVEGDGNLWGGVFICKGDNFIGEDVIFKNTYNYELTDAELTDIAGSTLNVDRLADGADVTAYAFKERSNAFYVNADKISLYNCKILSSQDTFGRNGSANNDYHVYLKDCVIGGNVDYICGEFTAVFDDCELQWLSYKDDEKNNAKIGYIVAPKTSPYVFRNCEVTTCGNEGESPVIGMLGRTWGKESNASFINLETNGHINSAAWGEMNAGDKESAIFNSYKITNKAVEMEITGGTNTSEEAVADYISVEKSCATLFGDWAPAHYSYTGLKERKINTPVEDKTGDVAVEESFAQNAEIISAGKTVDGEKSIQQAKEDNTALTVTYKKGKVKGLKINVIDDSASLDEYYVTVNAKSKLEIFGKKAYTIVSASDGIVAKKAASVKTNKKTLVTTVATKAIKNVDAYQITLSDGETSKVHVTIVNIGFKKDIKKAVVTAGDGTFTVTPNDGQIKNRITSGAWVLGKDGVVKAFGKNAAPQEVVVNAKKDYKVLAKVNENGGLEITPIATNGMKGALKISYIVNGKKYTTSVKFLDKLPKKGINDKQKAARKAIGL